MEFTFQMPDGDLKTVTLTPQHDGTFMAIIGTRCYIVRIHPSDSSILFIDGQKYIVHNAKGSSAHHVWLDGKTMRLEKTNPTASRPRQSHAGDLTAAMPGQVISVLAAEGDHVKKGQTLLVLEAMKMETHVKAPHDGVVKRMLCTVGDTVERGQVLVELAES